MSGVWAVGEWGGGKKTQQHPQGFPHALGFTPHVVYPPMWGQIPLSPCANPPHHEASVEKLSTPLSP